MSSELHYTLVTINLPVAAAWGCDCGGWGCESWGCESWGCEGWGCEGGGGRVTVVSGGGCWAAERNVRSHLYPRIHACLHNSLTWGSKGRSGRRGTHGVVTDVSASEVYKLVTQGVRENTLRMLMILWNSCTMACLLLDYHTYKAKSVYCSLLSMA